MARRQRDPFCSGGAPPPPPAVIVGPAFVVTGGRDPQVLEDGGVRISGAHVAQVGRIATLAASHPEETLWPARGRVLVPGLVNAHVHLARHLARGLMADGAIDWTRYDRALSPEDVYWSALASMVEGVKHGITTFCDVHRSDRCVELSLSEITRAATRLGVRVATGYAARESDTSAERAAARRESLSLAAELKRMRHGRLRGLAAVHATSAAGLGMLMEETLESLDADTPLQVELGFDAGSPLAPIERPERGTPMVWAHAESAPPGLVEAALAHGDLLASSRADAGSEPFGWGSDTGLNAPPLPAGSGADGDAQYSRVWVHGAEWASRHFGAGLGLIEPGSPADLALIDYAPPTPLDGRTFHAHVTTGLARARVSGVMVAGEILMDHGQVITVDETEVAARARESARRVWAAMG